jgi:hypothetical protein
MSAGIAGVVLMFLSAMALSPSPVRALGCVSGPRQGVGLSSGRRSLLPFGSGFLGLSGDLPVKLVTWMATMTFVATGNLQ